MTYPRLTARQCSNLPQLSLQPIESLPGLQQDTFLIVAGDLHLVDKKQVYFGLITDVPKGKEDESNPRSCDHCSSKGLTKIAFVHKNGHASPSWTCIFQ